MSRTFKKFDGFRRHYPGVDGVYQEKDLYRRSDRRKSANKSETDKFATWSDMKPIRAVRRNDGWQKNIDLEYREVEDQAVAGYVGYYD